MSEDAGRSPLLGRHVCLSRIGLGCLARLKGIPLGRVEWITDASRTWLFDAMPGSMSRVQHFLNNYHPGDFDWVPANEVLGWIVRGWNIEKIKGLLGEDVLIEEEYWSGTDSIGWTTKPHAKVYGDDDWRLADALEKWRKETNSCLQSPCPKSHAAWVLAFLPKVFASAGKSDVLIRDQSLCLCGTCSARRKKETA